MSYPRHTLCYLDKTATAISSHESSELDFLRSWIDQEFPLITPRQPLSLGSEQIQLALPYFNPTTQQKIRLSYLFSKSSIQKYTPLPYLSELFPQIPVEYEFIRVYGSYCWQFLTEKSYVQPASDLDILIEYSNQNLSSLEELHHQLELLIPHTKIDGEIRFQLLGDCSYIELIKQQEIPSLLFKSERGVELITREFLYARFPTLNG